MWEFVVTLKYVTAVLNLFHGAYKRENSWVKSYSSRVAFETAPAELRIPVVRSHSRFYGSAPCIIPASAGLPVVLKG